MSITATNDNRSLGQVTSAPINRLCGMSRKQRIGIVVMFLSVTWPFMAVWLHVHQLINNLVETYTSWWLCLPGIIFGAVCFGSGGQSKTVWQSVITLFLVVFSALVAIAIIIASRAYSDRMFTYWILNRIPIQTRQEMASEMNRRAKLLSQGEDKSFVRSDLPKGFDLLGRDDEYRQGKIMKAENGAGAVVEYGDKNRYWGFLVGPAYLPLYEKYKVISVADNVWFFLRDGW